jgi:hypothetical protein
MNDYTLNEVLALCGQTFPNRKFTSGTRQIIGMMSGKVDAIGDDRHFYFVERVVITPLSQNLRCLEADWPAVVLQNSFDDQPRVRFSPVMVLPTLGNPNVMTAAYEVEVFTDQITLDDPSSVVGCYIVLWSLVP